MGAAAMRRMMHVVLVVLVLGALGATIGVSDVAHAAVPAASSATPGVPTSTIEGSGNGTVTYCVSNYAPNSTVSVVNQANGATGTIHTDHAGSGCTKIAIVQSCTSSVSQTIVANGTDATGKPASSQATYNAPPDTKKCKPTPASTSSSSPPTTPPPTPSVAAGHCKPTQAFLSIYKIPQGEELRGHACGFKPGESVFIYLHSTPVFVGSTIANAAGIAAAPVTIPKCIAPGQHVFEMIGQTSGNVASAGFTVLNGATCSSIIPASVSSGGTGGGSLAFTGADILAMVLAALVLLVLGIIAVTTVRRRRSAQSA